MKLLHRIVTNRAALGMSHGLSEALNRLAGLGRGTKRRRERNRAALAEFREEGFIHGQGRGAVARLPFGKYTMDYNGCEVIASCNALRLLGNPRPLGEAAAYYERRGLFLSGFFGTHVSAVPGFFRSLGYAPRCLYASRVRDPGEYDGAFASAEAAVFSFWNSAKRLRNGVHTVALAHGEGGGLLIYNLHGTDRREDRSYGSIAEFVRSSGVLPILLVTILRKGAAGGPAESTDRA